MLPYWKLQVLYVTASAVATGGMFLLLGRIPALRHRAVLRASFTAFALGTACVAAYLFLMRFRSHGLPFGAVAVLFWSCGFVLPVLAPMAGLRSWAKHGKGFPFAAILLAAVAAGGAVYAGFVEPERLTVREERLAVPQWPEAERPFRLVHVSDLQTVGTRARDRRAAEAVNALNADLIVITGDYIAGPFFDPAPAIASARDFLSRLKARLGVVVVAGHSEPERIRREIFLGLDLVYLVDGSRRFVDGAGRGVTVHGMDVHSGSAPPGGIPHPAGDLVIVASHVPDVSGDLDGSGVDLHLAGHTHGGQVVVPLLGPPVTLSRLPGKYARGLHRFGDHWMNVCAGIGMEGHHAPPVRFLCPPEVCLILLDRSSERPERLTFLDTGGSRATDPQPRKSF